MRCIMARPEEKSAVESLTNRERDVLQLIAEGSSSKEVANQLDISVKTAETHRAKVMKKLNLHNTAKLTRFAIAEGLSHPRGIPSDKVIA